MTQKTNCTSPDLSASNTIDNKTLSSDVHQPLSSNFDDTVEILLNEMSETTTQSQRAPVADHYVLAAILLQGAYPVLH